MNMWTKLQPLPLGIIMKNVCNFFFSSAGPFYAGLRRVVCNLGVQTGLGVKSAFRTHRKLRKLLVHPKDKLTPEQKAETIYANALLAPNLHR